MFEEIYYSKSYDSLNTYSNFETVAVPFNKTILNEYKYYEFKLKFGFQINDHLLIILDDLDELTLDTSLKDDLNADSLDAVEVIMALEDKYDIEISEEDAEEFKTIGDIVNYIESK